MADLTGHPGLPLWSEYPRFVRRHRVLLAALMAVGLLGGLAWSTRQSAVYSATASVVLAPVPVYVQPASVGLVPPEVSIDTDAQLLHSPQVVRAVSSVLGEQRFRVERSLSISATPNSHVLHVTAHAVSPPLAAEAANAAVAALVDVRRDVLGALTSAQLRQLRLFISGQEDQLAREQARRLVVPAQEDLFGQLLELKAGLRELEEVRHEPARVIRPAVPPKHSDYANTEVPLASGAVAGLALGWLVGACRDRFRSARRPSRPDRPSPPASLTDATTRPEDDRHAA